MPGLRNAVDPADNPVRSGRITINLLIPGV
jgi:hypothetical protein